MPLSVAMLFAIAGISPAFSQDSLAVRAMRQNKPLEDPFPPERGHMGAALYLMEMPWGNPVFERFRASYLSPGGRAWIAAVARRSEPYADFIMERIKLYGLPDELFFLPFIESEYSPFVVSRSGAAGMWQFMINSIRGYDMRLDDWVDERRDFWKSTDGALRKLRENYMQLGDWNLALAAYNAGLGAVSRAVAKGESRDYYDLCARGFLPAETSTYVPKFMAVVSVAMYSGRNGFEPVWRKAVRWELVSLEKPVDIGLLAQAAAIPVELIKSGNPELRYNITPPDGGYLLKVPQDYSAPLRDALAREDLQLMRFYLYKVKSGDTLSALSKHYDVSIAMILRYNKGLRPELLKIGQTIVVPALKDKTPYVSAVSSRADGTVFSATHVVVKGDTLWSLSLRYGVQPEVLARRNGLSLESVLREGVSLNVPKM